MLPFIRRITQEMNAASGLREALRIVVERVCEAIHVDVCAIYLKDEKAQCYTLIASKGFNEGVDGVLKIDIHQGLVGLVGEREEPLNLENAPNHPSYAYFPETGEERYQAFMGVPIIHQRKVLGILVAQQTECRKFDENEEAFLLTVSAQLGGIIALVKAQGEIDGSQFRVQRESEIQGIPGAPGVAIGTAVRVYPLADLDAVPDRFITDVDMEVNVFLDALQAARDEMRQLSEQMKKTLPPEEQALFDAYINILERAGLGDEVIAVIRAKKLWSQAALRDVVTQHVLSFEAMEDVYLRERATDLRDLGARVLNKLQAEQKEVPEYFEQTILVGEEITASHLAEVPASKLVGIVCLRGSSNSHVAILARSMGIPTVMGAYELPLGGIERQTLAVDGYHGKVHLSPSLTVCKEFTRLMKEEKELYAGLQALHKEPAITPDGYHLPLLVNTGLVADIPSSLDVGAEGVGLYRTEVPFMIRDRFPSEAEQRQIYRHILQAFHPRPVTMRTLDVGGDKVLPYFNISEENPFLGWRGVRITLDHPEIFLIQLRAMLRASSGLNNLRIMLPMVSNVREIREARALVEQAYEEVQAEDPLVARPQIGVMVEVPSAVYQASVFANECDFLSVGSNDLTQYLLAVDRNNSRVANLYDSLHPAVLQALIHIVSSAHEQGKPASICGEMAGDPMSVILLLGMGYDSLSLNATSLTRVKWVIRSIPLLKAQDVLSRVMQMDDARDIRLLLENTMVEAGLGGLVRAGK